MTSAEGLVLERWCRRVSASPNLHLEELPERGGPASGTRAWGQLARWALVPGRSGRSVSVSRCRSRLPRPPRPSPVPVPA